MNVVYYMMNEKKKISQKDKGMLLNFQSGDDYSHGYAMCVRVCVCVVCFLAWMTWGGGGGGWGRNKWAD